MRSSFKKYWHLLDTDRDGSMSHQELRDFNPISTLFKLLSLSCVYCVYCDCGSRCNSAYMHARREQFWYSSSTITKLTLVSLNRVISVTIVSQSGRVIDQNDRSGEPETARITTVVAACTRISYFVHSLNSSHFNPISTPF